MEMDPSSSFSSASPPHLAMAAFFGALLVAVSAFFIHKRSVDQVLHRLIEIRRRTPAEVGDRLMAGDGEGQEEGFGGYEGFDVEEEDRESGGGRGEDGLNFIKRYGISSSVPNVGLSNEWFEDDSSKFEFHNPVGFCTRPLSSSLSKPNLAMLQRVLRDAHGVGSSLTPSDSSTRIATQTIGGNQLEKSVHSSGQGKELQMGDTRSVQENNNSTLSDGKLTVQESSSSPVKCDYPNGMKNQKSGVIAYEQKAILDLPANATLDISLTNDGNDFTVDNMLPLKAAIPELLNVEEEEVRRMLRECLELRQAYVYEEEVAPWNQSLDATESEKNGDPFCPVEKMDHDFRMEDGVIHVYASENDTTELFPVASATKFFTDVHHIY